MSTDVRLNFLVSAVFLLLLERILNLFTSLSPITFAMGVKITMINVSIGLLMDALKLRLRALNINRLRASTRRNP